MARKFIDWPHPNICRWGAERRVKRAQTREQGPPLAPPEISTVSTVFVLFLLVILVILLQLLLLLLPLLEPILFMVPLDLVFVNHLLSKLHKTGQNMHCWHQRKNVSNRGWGSK